MAFEMNQFNCSKLQNELNNPQMFLERLYKTLDIWHFFQQNFFLTKSLKFAIITFFNILFRTIRGRHFAVTPRQVWTDKSTLKMTTTWPQETWSWHNKGDKSKGQFPNFLSFQIFRLFSFDLKLTLFRC
jgi:hypothetical protein